MIACFLHFSFFFYAFTFLVFCMFSSHVCRMLSSLLSPTCILLYKVSHMQFLFFIAYKTNVSNIRRDPNNLPLPTLVESSASPLQSLKSSQSETQLVIPTSIPLAF
ncbi:hypothetical protein RchiOBHm_Chr3g0453791 [Rosa chinensis]|uniref:Uncharacterized protein n=1 Tax=Rosa chinensis TaxID=74649 RepID=A0A2P6R6M7_ROSCH|nr:hypothetical protein RchiOBHm_Chr3g0453791 [Rosa chinensis]